MFDAHGLPVVITLNTGQTSNIRGLDVLFDGYPNLVDVVADKGYDAKPVLARIAALGHLFEIHSRFQPDTSLNAQSNTGIGAPIIATFE